jgi:hypothetical protein
MDIPGVQVEGTFNAQRFFDTLAMLISNREGVQVTVKVTQEPKEKEDEKTA